jgi:hypothetical protein
MCAVLNDFKACSYVRSSGILEIVGGAFMKSFSPLQRSCEAISVILETELRTSGVILNVFCEQRSEVCVGER